MRTAAALLLVGLAAVACSGQGLVTPQPASTTSQQVDRPPDPVEETPTDETTTGEPSVEPPLSPVTPTDFRAQSAMETVQHLAGVIGPRHATSETYDRAARWVARRFRELGLEVRRQGVEVPAGISWGVRVEGGRSVNVVASAPSYEPGRPHLVIGAHLDTVPQAPGAEDNASGVGVLLAIAEAVGQRTTRLPVVFVAFGAEEPRGETDADHHYGSRTYVAALEPAERESIRGMLSLDRVGVGDVVPIGSARDDADPVARQLERAARAAGVPVVRELNRSSDHWQFVQAGLPGVRLGSTPYAGYHSAQDVPGVVERAQLQRVGRVVLQWLAP